MAEVRRARPDDAAELTRLRVVMFTDMGRDPAPLDEDWLRRNDRPHRPGPDPPLSLILVRGRPAAAWRDGIAGVEAAYVAIGASAAVATELGSGVVIVAVDEAEHDRPAIQGHRYT